MKRIVFLILMAVLSSSCIFKMMAVEDLDSEIVGWSVVNKTGQDIFVELTKAQSYIVKPDSSAYYFLSTSNATFNSYWNYLQREYGVLAEMKIYTANKDVQLKEWSCGVKDNTDKHHFFDEKSWVKGKHAAGFTLWTFTLTDEDF